MRSDPDVVYSLRLNSPMVASILRRYLARCPD
jgi:hypothetical protein